MSGTRLSWRRWIGTFAALALLGVGGVLVLDRGPFVEPSFLGVASFTPASDWDVEGFLVDTEGIDGIAWSLEAAELHVTLVDGAQDIVTLRASVDTWRRGRRSAVRVLATGISAADYARADAIRIHGELTYERLLVGSREEPLDCTGSLRLATSGDAAWAALAPP